METGEDSPQHQLLQRCKHTIETLHQELIHLQINNELLVSETEGMKKVLAEKDMVIYELQGRINAMQMDEGAGDESYRQQSIGEREELFGRYLKVVADNNQLRRELEYARVGRGEKRRLTMSGKAMDSGLFCSREIDSGSDQMVVGRDSEEMVISVNDMLASDKKILIYLVQQKDREIQSLTKVNQTLREEKDKLVKYCKGVVNRVDSQYQIILKEDSVSEVLRTPKTKKKLSSSRVSRGYDEYGNVRKESVKKPTAEDRTSNALTKSKSIKRVETVALKSPDRSQYQTERKGERQPSPQYYYYRRTQ